MLLIFFFFLVGDVVIVGVVGWVILVEGEGEGIWVVVVIIGVGGLLIEGGLIGGCILEVRYCFIVFMSGYLFCL